MIRFLNSFFNFLLYSNLFIAACAIALCLQTFAMQGQAVRWWLVAEIFAATQCIYALHRLVSLKRLKPELINQRFKNIRALKGLIWALFFLSVAIGFYGFWQLEIATQMALILPAILSLGYVLPIWKTKRLRDFHLIKIFLIAGVWAYVTVFLPAMELGLPLNINLYWIFSERALFIFAITLPFDIRDMEIEKANGVKTIPALIGAKSSIYLGIGLLLLWGALNYFLYPFYTASLMIIIALITLLLVAFSHPRKPDWYYTGLLDGTMLLQGLFVYLML
jgi:4-hydroxybenzoate polyprenyltransferase